MSRHADERLERRADDARGDAAATAWRARGYILVVDDEPEIRRLIREILEDEHYRVATAENAASARAAFARERPDLVLLDIWMPDADGITLLKEWAAGGRLEVPVVMLSGHATVETAVEATRLGAYDFIEKPLSMGKLLVTVEHALEAERLRRENQRLRAAAGGGAEPEAFLVGKSAPMQKLRETLERVAAADTWVLISGEPGSGRLSAARYLHAKSARAAGPFVELTLPGLIPQNVALKLFGVERDGTVTPGVLEQARGGTAVLNGIEELDRATQALLLHTLTERSFTRIAGSERLPLEARLIAIAGPELAARVADGRFREDLYYRLNVVPVAIPPLREHREDVPELVSFILNFLVDRERLPYRRFTSAALNRLRTYAWPGNVRELRNVVQRLLILARGEEISEEEAAAALGAEEGPVSAVPSALFEQPLKRAREQFERAYLEYHLARAHGNVGEVARVSGLERTHLYRKLKQLGLQPKSLKAPQE